MFFGVFGAVLVPEEHLRSGPSEPQTPTRLNFDDTSGDPVELGAWLTFYMLQNWTADKEFRSNVLHLMRNPATDLGMRYQMNVPSDRQTHMITPVEAAVLSLAVKSGFFETFYRREMRLACYMAVVSELMTHKKVRPDDLASARLLAERRNNLPCLQVLACGLI